MGMQSAPSCCQRVTNAIAYIYEEAGYWLMNYIDDFISADKWSIIWESYLSLGRLLKDIGAQEAVDKASPPDTRVECLGTMFDTVAMTISVTPERLVELKRLLDMWCNKTTATRRDLECLIGKIQFVSNCVRQGRIYLNRLLQWLHTLGNDRTKQHEIPQEA